MRRTRGLAPVARVESYRGFVFANCSLKGPALVDYLGPMSRAIDNLVDRAPNGRLKMTVGFRQEYRRKLETAHGERQRPHACLDPAYLVG